MKYEIGQQVETPLGVGIVEAVGKEIVYVSVGNFPPIPFIDVALKPYKSAHDKLVEMGFNATLGFDKYPIYRTNELELLFNPQAKTYYLAKWEEATIVSLELSRILTQYLEEMAE